MENVLPQSTWDICQKDLNEEKKHACFLSYLRRPTVRFSELKLRKYDIILSSYWIYLALLPRLLVPLFVQKNKSGLSLCLF